MGNQQANSDIFKNQHELEEEFKNEPNNTLLVKTHTWSKDSHGLYDYKGENTFVEQKMKIYKSGVILRDSENLTFNEEKNSEQLINKDQLSQNSLLNITQLNNQTYRVEQSQGNKLNGCQHNEQNDHQIWLIVRSLKNIKGGKNGCLLKEQDYIKLGRVRFRIKEIFTSNSNSQQQSTQMPVFEQYNKIQSTGNIKKVQTQGTVPDDDNGQNSEGEIKEEGKACRFCLSDTATADDPLLNPCNCSGSVKYVHIKCLKQWLQNKITTKSSIFSTAYNWKSLQCELCSYQYPQQITQNGVNYPTFDIKKPEGPYIILEILVKDKNQSKGIHVLNFSQNKDTIKIGRGSDSDMKVQDISVSRGHAQIKFYKNNFYLEDLDSKFGTLALIKNHIDLSNNTNKIAIQVNRTVFSFYMKQSQNNFIPCGQKQKKVKDFILNPPAEIDGQNNKQKSSVLKQDDVKTKVNEDVLYKHNKNLKNNEDIFGEIGDMQPLDIEEEKKDQEINIQIMKSKQHRPNNLQISNLCQSQKQQQIQTENDHLMFEDDNNNINKIQDSNINYIDKNQMSCNFDDDNIQTKQKNSDSKNMFVDNFGGLKWTSCSNNNSEKKNEVGILQFDEDEEFEESVNDGDNMNRMVNLQMHSNNLNQKEESEAQNKQIYVTQNQLEEKE